ncbi:hypothetical protein C8R43DRAFT_989479 [Mycena crocata]|nr:hypothetical protein C8R43DRAFT_989479 [Mycena crocata]
MASLEATSGSERKSAKAPLVSYLKVCSSPCPFFCFRVVQTVPDIPLRSNWTSPYCSPDISGMLRSNLGGSECLLNGTRRSIVQSIGHWTILGHFGGCDELLLFSALAGQHQEHRSSLVYDLVLCGDPAAKIPPSSSQSSTVLVTVLDLFSADEMRKTLLFPLRSYHLEGCRTSLVHGPASRCSLNAGTTDKPAISLRFSFSLFSRSQTVSDCPFL